MATRSQDSVGPKFGLSTSSFGALLDSGGTEGLCGSEG